ncbi:MAG: GNAT family N-acetyltransferase [Oscillospiraceae bacterium]|nr:GNAT family N-acetyltransferase [Oscillospiraceae bacterium]
MSVFEELLTENRNAAEAFVWRRLSGEDGVEDVLQEVYLAAWRGFGALQDRQNFRAWLLRIAANKCNDFYRRNYSQGKLAAKVNTATTPDVGDLISEVADTLERLSLEDRHLLRLFYYEDRSHAELATLLGVPVGTVKSRLHSARMRFKDIYPLSPRTKGSLKMIVKFICTKNSLRNGLVDRSGITPFDSRKDYDILNEYFGEFGENLMCSRDEYFDGSWDPAAYEEFVIMENGKIVSRAAIFHHEDGREEVAAVATVPRFRHLGHAARLVRLCTEKILSRGKIAYISVREDNLPMLNLAREVGFTAVQ